VVWVDSATPFELRDCSVVARAISPTRSLASRQASWIVTSAAPASCDRSTPLATALIPASIARTAPDDSISISAIRLSMSWVEPAVLWDSVLTWLATTRNAFPCSPACAAMMAALSERSFVSSLISSIAARMLPIWEMRETSPPRRSLASFVSDEICSMSVIVARTASAPAAAPAWARSVRDAASSAFEDTS